jgi:AcrR family transcriptional regulator
LRADAARNRARVLAAAEELFAEVGVDAQLLDIAKRAGVGAGTVYRHFPTKDVLFAEVLSARMSDLLDQADALSADSSPGGAFYTFWALATEQAQRNAAICHAFISSTGQELPGSGELRARFQSTLARLLAAAQTDGSVRTDVDVKDVTALLSASVLAQQRRGDTRQPGRLVNIIASGLRPAQEPQRPRRE